MCVALHLNPSFLRGDWGQLRVVSLWLLCNQLRIQPTVAPLSRTPAFVRPRTDERPCRFSVSLFNTTNHKIPGSEEVIISREYRIVLKIWMDNSYCTILWRVTQNASEWCALCPFIRTRRCLRPTHIQVTLAWFTLWIIILSFLVRQWCQNNRSYINFQLEGSNSHVRARINRCLCICFGKLGVFCVISRPFHFSFWRTSIKSVIA